MRSEQSWKQSAEHKARRTMFRILQMCGLYHVEETLQHFFTHVKEHLASDRASHIFKHLKKILNTVAPCAQQIVSMFWITPPPVFILFESTITLCLYNIISLILTLSLSFCCNFYHRWHFLLIISASTALYFNSLRMTEVSVETCFINSNVWSFSRNSWLVCDYQDRLESQITRDETDLQYMWVT